MRIDHEDKDLIQGSHRIAYKSIVADLSSYDGIVISDYDKGMVKPIS